MSGVSCDVLVVGGGPAGIAAASRAAESGARTLLVDEGPALGGQIWRAAYSGGRPARATRWVSRLSRSGALVRTGTSVVDLALRDGVAHVRAETGSTTLVVGARSLVLATGARELLLPFPGWTLPNVFGVGGAQALVKSGMPVRGKRVVVAGSGPLVLAVASSLAAHGARVLIVVEQAPRGRVMRFAAGLWRSPSRLAQAVAYRARLAGVRYALGAWIARADGDTRVRSATLTDGATSWTVDCDMVCAAFGLVPNVELPRLAGCAVEDGVVRVDGRQATTVDRVFCAGEPTGIGGVDLSLVEGEIAGAAAAGSAVEARRPAARERLQREAASLDRAFALRAEVTRLADADTTVCRCEDVRLGALDPSWSVRQAKLYTRAGMGPCQGRICGAALECLLGWSRETPRPPVQPARVASLLDSESSVPVA